MINKAIDLLYSAKQNEIDILLVEDQLQVRTPKNKDIDKNLLQELKDNKELIIDFLRNNQRSNVNHNRITKFDKDTIGNIPLSFSQERLWFIDQLEGSLQYHMPAVLRLKGSLNENALEYALQNIVNRHEVLRTVIREEDGKGYQIIKDKDNWKLQIIDGSQYKQDKERLNNYVKQLINIPFDLSEDYMIRGHLIKINDNEHILVVTLHHIASDGWSISVIVKELIELYKSYEENREANLLPLPIQYSDYAIWQREYLNEEVLERKLSYWKKKLDGIDPLQLPTDFTRPAVQSTKGATERFSIDKALSEKLQLLSQQQGVTLFMTLLSAFKVLLYRYSSQPDICVGIGISGRQQKELENLVGFFINTLALRSDLSNNPGFIDLLQQVKLTTLEAYDHQDVPFEKVLESVVKERDMSRSPLFQVMFVLQNAPEVPQLRLGEVELFKEPVVYDTSKFELIFSFTETANGLVGAVEYCTDLYVPETIRRMTDHFKELLCSIAETPEQNIGSLSLMTKSEEHQLLSEFNDTAMEYPKDKTIVDLFEEQVVKAPDNIALIFEDQQLTYKELNKRANQLAHYLKTKGVKSGSLVPVCIERGIDLIAGILGILKAGGAYVPIDPEYPEERIKFMLEDTGATIVLSNKAIRSRLSAEENIEIIETDGDLAKVSKHSSDNLQKVAGPDNLAYVVYTSGSTGKPKGVMIEHRALANLIHWHNRDYEVSSLSSATQIAGIGFDAFGWEVWPYLSAGASITIIEDDTRLSTSALISLFTSNNISHCFIPTALVSEFVNASRKKLKSLRYLLAGGDKLQGLSAEGESYKLVNNYGPTENTVVASYYILSEKDPYLIPPIGKPIANNTIYILSNENQLSPLGVVGEICISGDSLSRGYLNHSELTSEKFTSNPFSSETGSRIYRTGDLGRWLPDGNIEYSGRIDDQVKIRGYRIELGEIESVLQESETVRQSVVLAHKTPEGSRRLVGYVVPEGKFNKEALISYLKSRLPEYMVPMIWVELESMPLTQNGKIDKKALPDLIPDAGGLTGNEYVAPRNETEEILSVIWKDLLHAERVGMNDNFFELGGDSIITIQVVSRARRAGYEIKPKDIFIHQTIGSLSAAISERASGAVTGEQGVLTGESGLLPIQQWYLEGAGEAVSYFNQTVLLSIDKSVTQDILGKAVEQLTLHHDALRFKYNFKNTFKNTKDKDAQWIQEYGTKPAELITVDLQTAEKDKLGSLIKEQSEKYQRSLNIETGEIVRIVLLQTPEEETKNRILLVIHHLAVDGVSWRIILEDLEHLITGLQGEGKADLGSKSSSYRQWYDALVQYGKSKKLLSQSSYWERTELSNEGLPVDKEYTGRLSLKDIKTETIRLDKEQTRKLIQEVPRVYHTEINDILLCALAITLCDWSSKQKVIIAMEGHGRESISEQTDTSRTVGWFTSLYPLLLELRDQRSLPEAIKSVKEQLRQVPDKGLGYGVLKYINKNINYINKEERLSEEHSWDIVFNYLGQLDNVVSSSGSSSGKWFTGAGESRGASTSEEHIVSNKLSVTGMVQSSELIINLSYSLLHYEKGTIEKLLESYRSNIESLITHCIEQEKESGVVYTPSDYGLGTEISYAELDKFLEEPYKGRSRRESIEGIYRLSGLQEGMLFHALYDLRSSAYTEQLSCDLSVPDLEIISKSWNRVLRSHSILRSGFYYDEFSIPVQCVYKEVEMPVELLDYRDMEAEEQETAIRDYRESDRLKGFDFKTVPLMRIALIRLSEERYRMLWTSHHILFDGWSLQILVEEFLSNYEQLVTGQELAEIEEDRYEDYIRYTERSDKDSEEKYWRSYMQAVEQSTLLPFIGITADRTKGLGVYEAMHLRLDAEITSEINQFAQKHHITINTLMQGVWSYLLHGYTGSDEVVYGVIVSGRPDDLPGIWQRVGLYINTLPLHTTMRKEESISQWLQELQKNEVSSRQYQYTPIQEIQRWTGVSGDLFDSLLVFENYPVSDIVKTKQWSLQVQNMQVQEQTNYPLTIIVGSGEKINIAFSYNTQILDKEYLAEIRDHFENVLMQVIRNPQSSLGSIELLSLPEKNRILREFNDTASEYPKDKTIIGLFEEQVKRTPDKTALIFEGEHLSYRELNERSNQLAHYLRMKGVKEETLVPICIERSMYIITGILGILKAGGAYVPVHPEYPEDRIRYMLEDTGSSIVVSSKASRQKLEDILRENQETQEFEVIETDADSDSDSDSIQSSEISKQSKENLNIEIKPHQLAYVIYTSGSTGKPKGVMIENENVVRLFKTETQLFDFSEKDVWTLFHSFCFDFSVWEMYGALLYGGSLVIVPGEVTKDASLFSELLLSEKVTVLNQTPSAFYVLQDIVADKVKDKDKALSVRYVIFGGEALNPSKLQPWKQLYPDCRLINMYGITETTVHVTYQEIGQQNIAGDRSIIGKAIPTLSAYILNKDQHLVPVGVIGEMYIGGAGLARGYLNHPELTQQRFIEDPLSTEPGARLYRTGDLGRWLPDGSIEYLGRIDDQVKIRGYRIELGEIESVLQECESVRQSVVLGRQTEEGSRRLVGYVVANGVFDREEIISYLRSKLPEYMVPALWVEMESFPLTKNGKIDHKALPEPDVSGLLRDQYAEPRNETERVLAEIWKNLLGIEKVGIYDNFFELGGHSLMIIKMVSLIKKRLSVSIPVLLLFQFTSISDISKYLDWEQDSEKGNDPAAFEVLSI